MNSILTKRQVKTVKKQFKDCGESVKGTLNIRYDDNCGNSHNTFSMTVDIKSLHGRFISAGCQHEIVEKEFPKFKKYIKWHLCSSDEPMHYVANTVYHAEQGKLDSARNTAIWEDATIEQLKDKDALMDRLPALMAEFKHDMEELGFVY